MDDLKSIRPIRIGKAGAVKSSVLAQEHAFSGPKQGEAMMAVVVADIFSLSHCTVDAAWVMLRMGPVRRSPLVYPTLT